MVMVLGFNCPHCGMVTRVNAFKPGDTIQCQRCGKHLVIPDTLHDVHTLIETPINNATPNSPYIKHETPISNPYLQFWAEPRATFRHALANDRFMEALVLITMTSAIGTINGLLFTPADAEANMFAGGKGAVLFFLFTLMAFFVGTIMYWLCGKMLGGKGDLSSIVIALGWSQLPGLLSVFLIPLGILYQYSIQDGSNNWSLLYGLYMLVIFCIGVYSIILSVIAISEAHQLTIGQSIGTLALAFCGFVVVVIIIMLILVVFGFAFGLFEGVTS